MSTLHRISSACTDAARAADVVFVHGLGGDALATWRHGAGETTSWPHWLAEEFPSIGIWSLGYAASASAWPRSLRRIPVLGRWVPASRDAGHSMPLQRRGRQVLDLFELHDLGHRPTLFICHSMGGLLAKEILRKASESVADTGAALCESTRAVLFLATPHAGSDLASLADRFSAVLGTTVSIEDLRAHGAHLEDLYDWYRNHTPRLGVETRTYYEGRALRGATIVDPTSSHPGVGTDPIPLDEDHVSIAKPRHRDAQVYVAARSLVARLLLKSGGVPVQAVACADDGARSADAESAVETRDPTIILDTTEAWPVPEDAPPLDSGERRGTWRQDKDEEGNPILIMEARTANEPYRLMFGGKAFLQQDGTLGPSVKPHTGPPARLVCEWSMYCTHAEARVKVVPQVKRSPSGGTDFISQWPSQHGHEAPKSGWLDFEGAKEIEVDPSVEWWLRVELRHQTERGATVQLRRLIVRDLSRSSVDARGGPRTGA